MARERVLELGGGENPATDGVNADVAAVPGVDVVADVTEEWPFERASFDRIEAHHVLEHLPHDDLPTVFRQVAETLRDDGEFYAEVPLAHSRSAKNDPTHRSTWYWRTPMYYTAEGRTVLRGRSRRRVDRRPPERPAVRNLRKVVREATLLAAQAAFEAEPVADRTRETTVRDGRAGVHDAQTEVSRWERPSRRTAPEALQGAGIVFTGVVLELVVSFVAKLLIARYLGPTDYGAVSIGLKLMTATSIFVLVGLDSGIGRYLPRRDDPADRRGVLKSALEIALPVGLLAGVGLFLTADPIAVRVFHDPAVAPVIRVFSVVLPFAVVFRMAIGGVQGMQQSLPKVFIQNLTLPISRFLLIAVVLLYGLGTVAAAWAWGSPTSSPACWGVLPGPLHAPVRGRAGHVDAPRTPRVLGAADDNRRDAPGTLPHRHVLPGLLRLDHRRRRLQRRLSARPATHGRPVGVRIHGDAGHLVARRWGLRRGDAPDLPASPQKWILLATLPVFLVVVLFPEMVIRVTFGAEYDQGALALSVLAVGFFTHAVVGPNGNTLTSVGRTRLIMYDNVAVAVTNVTLNLLLIPGTGYSARPSRRRSPTDC